jgi:transcriptional regulator with XRE-family HTH domain
MNAIQCRAGRAVLGWSQGDLATAAGISITTVANFERGATVPMRANLAALKRALEDAGVVLLDEGSPGARLRVPPARLRTRIARARLRLGNGPEVMTVGSVG